MKPIKLFSITLFFITIGWPCLGQNETKRSTETIIYVEEILYDEYINMPAYKKEIIDNDIEHYKIVSKLSEKKEIPASRKIIVEEILYGEYMAMPAYKKQIIDNEPERYKIVKTLSPKQKIPAVTPVVEEISREEYDIMPAYKKEYINNNPGSFRIVNK